MVAWLWSSVLLLIKSRVSNCNLKEVAAVRNHIIRDLFFFIVTMHATRLLESNIFCFNWPLISLGNGTFFTFIIVFYGRSQWPRGLRRRSAAAGLLRSWVRIPLEA